MNKYSYKIAIISFVFLMSMMFACSHVSNMNCKNLIIENGKLVQDNKVVLNFSEHNLHEPSLLRDSLDKLLLYDGFRFILRFDCSTYSVEDTFKIQHRILYQPKLANLSSDFFMLGIGLERYIISKEHFYKYGQYTDSILRVFENKNYDTYDFDYSDVKLNDSTITFFLQGNVKYDSVSFDLAPLN